MHESGATFFLSFLIFISYIQFFSFLFSGFFSTFRLSNIPFLFQRILILFPIFVVYYKFTHIQKHLLWKNAYFKILFECTPNCSLKCILCIFRSKILRVRIELTLESSKNILLENIRTLCPILFLL